MAERDVSLGHGGSKKSRHRFGVFVCGHQDPPEHGEQWMISACVADPFAGRLRIRGSGEDAFTVPQVGASGRLHRASINAIAEENPCQLKAWVARHFDPAPAPT